MRPLDPSAKLSSIPASNRQADVIILLAFFTRTAPIGCLHLHHGVTVRRGYHCATHGGKPAGGGARPAQGARQAPHGRTMVNTGGLCSQFRTARAADLITRPQPASGYTRDPLIPSPEIAPDARRAVIRASSLNSTSPVQKGRKTASDAQCRHPAARPEVSSPLRRLPAPLPGHEMPKRTETVSGAKAGILRPARGFSRRRALLARARGRPQGRDFPRCGEGHNPAAHRGGQKPRKRGGATGCAGPPAQKPSAPRQRG